MFERLSEGFSSALRKISGRGTISESNIREAVEEVRTALLDADVNLSVVNEFCEEVVQNSLGRKVTASLRPGQEFIGVVHERLVALMQGGDGEAPPDPADRGVMRVSPGPTVVMMCGLQGSGKTTTCGKLAAYLKKRGRSVMLAAADLQRPAAVEQLRIVAEHAQNDVSGGAQVAFYAEPDKVAEYGKAVGVAVQVCQRAFKAAREQGIDTLILDTAGRLHIDDALMNELQQINRSVQPHQIYLVVDAMTGQDAVASAKVFHERLNVDGVILTKFDSDTRGGAALSVRRVTGAPIRFVGTGEKIDALEEFHADRIAGRILGMGDVVSLVERAQEQVSEEEALEIQEKMARGEMTLDDFLKQMRSLRRMGPLKQLLGLLPGLGPAVKDLAVDDKQFDRVEAMIHSMTPEERRDVSVIDGSHRRRIAAGSGTQQADVGKLTKQFEAVSKLAKQMAGLGALGKVKAMRQLQAAQAGGAMAGLTGKGSTATRSIKAGYKKRKKR